MSYVQPSGTIQLFRGVNLDNRYMHTLYFPNVSTQTSFFDGIVDAGLSFTNQSYSRPNRKTVRVKINAENCQDVSYMRFNNRGNKWYYAFVLAINYVNENATDIVYEIDVMQTWFMSGDSPTQMINPCMVLREHIANDRFGANLEAEPIGSEVYDMNELTTDAMKADFATYNWVLHTSNNYEAGGESGSGVGLYDGIPTGGAIFTGLADSDHIGGLATAIIDQLGSWDKNQQSADILDLYMFPSAFMGQGNHDKTYTIHHPKKYDNYRPQNRKMLTYPYCFLYATTNDGTNAQFRWEYFENLDVDLDSDIELDVCSCRTGGGSISLSPKDYNGIEDNYDAKLVMNNFPKCSASYDAYQAFIANGGSSKLAYQSSLIQRRGAVTTAQLAWNTALDTAQSAISIGRNIASGNVAGVGQSALQATQNFGNSMLQNQMIGLDLEEAQNKVRFQFKDAKYQPDIMVGETNANLAVGKGFLRFRLFNCHIRDSEMSRVDDFFSVYGYATNTVKLPNMTGRPYWNFVQTENCNIKGNMPSSSKQAIAKIFDGGIFFWNYQRGLGNIGNFRQSETEDGRIINK